MTSIFFKNRKNGQRYFFFAFILYLFIAAVNLRAARDESDTKAAKISTETAKEKKNPTVITSDSMDLDMRKKLIVLTGDVVVNDHRSTIYSDKMYVYLTNKSESAKNKVSKNKHTDTELTVDNKKTEKKDAFNSAGSQKVDKIIAIGHVVIIKKQKPLKGKAQPVQKATGGKAVYDTKTETIVLTKKPKLIQGDSYVAGTRIILWKNSDRLKVEGNKSTGVERSKLILTPNDEAEMK